MCVCARAACEEGGTDLVTSRTSFPRTGTHPTTWRTPSAYTWRARPLLASIENVPATARPAAAATPPGDDGMAAFRASTGFHAAPSVLRRLEMMTYSSAPTTTTTTTTTRRPFRAVPPSANPRRFQPLCVAHPLQRAAQTELPGSP